MWKLCLAPLLAASAAGLRRHSLLDFNGSAAAARSAAAAQGHEKCAAFPGKQVVMVTVNTDFFEFFQNWLHFAGPYLTSSEQVVAFAEDKEVVPKLHRFMSEGAVTPFKIVTPVNKTHWELSLAAGMSSSRGTYEIDVQDADPYQSKPYKELVSQRPRQISLFLDQNCSVLYADIDTAWLQNPFDSISRAGDYEMYVTDDRRPGKGLTSRYLCSCFLYMHPTSKVKAVMRSWESLMRGTPKTNQHRFNTAFHEIRRRHPGFAVALPREEFPPGGVNSTNPTVLHANGITGEGIKKTYLQMHGGWSLN